MMTVRSTQLRETTYIAPPSVISREQWYRATKRILDVTLTSILLVLLAPLMVVIALLIALDSPGSPIFRQQRVSGDQDQTDDNAASHTFTFFKFRSMREDADPALHQRFVEKLIEAGSSAAKQDNGLHKLANDPRVTRVGRFLRATSLDELPQLFNVLRGDMSLVGPRPAIPYEVSKYQGWHRQRLEVTAGITGLWQVKGRNGLSFDEMVQLDNTYVETRSLHMDLEILLKTIPVVIFGHNTC